MHFLVVLVLFIWDFEFEPAPLAKALGLKLKTMGFYLTRVGCRPVNQVTKKLESGWGQFALARLMKG